MPAAAPAVVLAAEPVEEPAAEPAAAPVAATSITATEPTGLSGTSTLGVNLDTGPPAVTREARGGGDSVTASGVVSLGTLSLDSNGVVQIDISSASSYGQVVISGSGLLNGQLQVVLQGGYVPVAGTTFNIITANSLTGAFASATGLFGAGGQANFFKVTKTANGIQLTVTPLPGGGLVFTPATQTDADTFGEILNPGYFTLPGGTSESGV